MQEARVRLERVRSEAETIPLQKRTDFYFVINDRHTYTTLEDFKSSDARKKTAAWVEEKKKLTALEQALETARNQYAAASASQKKNMSLSLLEGIRVHGDYESS